jgi:asparagine synthase (glutamine-hydrolysing)
MCGLAGWVSYSRTLDTELDVLGAMTATVACRGPDADGLWVDRHVGLGHRRLAVVDLAGGAQPMMAQTPRGPVVLTYVGEIYNASELRAELCARQHRFRTRSDTEVVLEGYLEWGEELPSRLNGMFAFAVWDGRANTLVLVRDRLGVKPLCYVPTPDGMIFGSEPKALLAHPDVAPTVDLDGLRRLLGFVKEPGSTLWARIKEVRPGSVVTVNREGYRERAYWTLSAVPHLDDLDTTVATTRELLVDIVRRQLVADVPTCMLLSGGLDSSAVTALAARQLAQQGEQVRSFGVAFAHEGRAFEPGALRGTEDAPFARALASHVGAAHSELLLEPTTLADRAVRRAVVGAKDSPLCLEDIDAPLYLLCRRVRAHATVALSGEAADESFGGYAHFHDSAAVSRPTFPWFPVGRAGVTRRPLVRRDLVERLRLPRYVRDTYASALAAVPHLDGESAIDRRMRDVCHLHLTHLLPVLLDRKDRMSMATGLEVRVPFCDHRLVEYVFNVPWSMKTFDGREKSLLRGAVADLLPPQVIQRRKSVFPSTQDSAYVALLQTQLREVVDDIAHPVFDIYDRQTVAEVLAVPPAEIERADRTVMESTLNLHAWIDLRRPVFTLT